MGLTRRVLPRDEYHRLVGTELECATALPGGSQVLVVEDGAEIVGCWALLSVLHVEGAWVAPTHRASASRHLLHGMADLVADAGGAAVLTGSMSPRVTRLLKGLGATKLDFDQYVVNLERWLTPEDACPQP